MLKHYEISIEKAFQQELFNILLYIDIALCNKKAAIDLNSAITKAIAKRSFFPMAYEPLDTPTLSKPHYRIYVNNYVVYYTTSENEMFIRHIFYAKRDRLKLL